MIRLFPMEGWFHVDGELAPIANQMRMFMVLYFALTGMHALHMVIGIVLLVVIMNMARKGAFTPRWFTSRSAPLHRPARPTPSARSAAG